MRLRVTSHATDSADMRPLHFIATSRLSSGIWVAWTLAATGIGVLFPPAMVVVSLRDIFQRGMTVPNQGLSGPFDKCPKKGPSKMPVLESLAVVAFNGGSRKRGRPWAVSGSCCAHLSAHPVYRAA